MKLVFLCLIGLYLSSGVIISSESYNKFSRYDFERKGRLKIPCKRNFWRSASQSVIVNLFGITYEGKLDLQGDFEVTTAFDKDGYKVIFKKNLKTDQNSFEYDHPYFKK